MSTVILFAALTLTIGAVSSLLLFLLYSALGRRQDLPPFWVALAKMVGAHRDEEHSNFRVIMDQIGKGLKRSTIRTLGGRDRASRSLTLRLATGDWQEVMFIRSLEEICQEIADKYVDIAHQKSWLSIPTDFVDVYVLCDPKMSVNSPSVGIGKPEANAGPAIRVKLTKFESFSSTDVTSKSSDPVTPVVETSFGVQSVPPSQAHEFTRHYSLNDVDATFPYHPDHEGPSSLKYFAFVSFDGRPAELLTESGLTIGRGSYNAIIDSDPSVSRSHAAIIFKEDRWMIVPEAKTFFVLNGRIHKNPVELSHDDTFTLASSKSVFSFRQGDPK